MRRIRTGLVPRRAWPVSLAVMVALGSVLSAVAFAGGPLGALAGGAHTAYGATLGSGSGTAQTSSHSPQPVHLTAHWSKTPPARSAAEQQAEAQRLQLLRQLKPAPVGPRTSARPADPRTISAPLPAPRYSVQHPPAHTAPHGPAVPATAPGGALAENSFDAALYSSPFNNGGICPTDCSTSDEMDASVANAGKYIVVTGNYFFAKSADDGSTYSYLDPYTFGNLPGFFGEQQVLYEPSHNAMIWEQMHFDGWGSADNGIWLLSSAPNDLTNWCAWFISGPAVGMPSGTILNWPKIEYSANFLYLTWNSFDASDAWVNSGLLRVGPLSAFSSNCTGFGSVSYLLRTDQFTFTLGQGATDTMYWASNWYTSGSGNGSAARFYFWGEKTSTYSYQDKSIPAYNFTQAAGNCASQDGVVTNWCGLLLPSFDALFRSRAGFKGFGAPMLGYFIQAGPNSSSYGTCDPFPYVEAVYFLLSNMSLKQFEFYYNCGYAVTWPSAAAPTQRGYIGAAFFYGGGIGTGASAVDYYPAAFYMILDTDVPNAPGSTAFDFGSANTFDGNWGQYLTVRPWNPDQLHWIAADWWMLGTYAIPFVVVFGKGRDHYSYLYWSSV
jgi:hypothetical protein